MLIHIQPQTGLHGLYGAWDFWRLTSSRPQQRGIIVIAQSNPDDWRMISLEVNGMYFIW